MKPIVLLPGEGEAASLGPTTVRFLAQHVDDEALSVTEGVLAPGFPGPVPHSHEHTYDCFYVLEGQVEFLVANEPRVAGPGTFVAAPPNVVHGFRVAGDEPIRFLNLHAPPGGFVDRLRADD